MIVQGRRALEFSLELKLKDPESSSCVSKCMGFGELWLSVPGGQPTLIGRSHPGEDSDTLLTE